MRNQIVILAAGKGTRMGNQDVPKVLVMLKNKPLILYVLDEIEKINQLAKPVIVVGYKYRQVMDVLGEGYSYAIQNEQFGTAHALLAAKNKIIGENILVLYGDMPCLRAESLKALMSLHHQTHSKITMFTTSVPDFERRYSPFSHFGRIIRDKGNIVKIVEFKDASAEQKEIKEVNPGIYMFNTQWLWRHATKIQNQNAQAEYYLTDIVEVAILAGERLESLTIDPKEVFGINSTADLELAESLVGAKD